MNILISGAGSGIGYQTVLHLLKDKSHHVFAISRNEMNLSALSEASFKEKLPGTLSVFACDICQENERSSLLATLELQIDSLDMLVNNAGLLIKNKFENLTWEDWVNIYRTNVFGVAALVRDLLPLLSNAPMKDAGYRAHVVNIGSMGGLNGTSKFSGLSAYSSSKAALSVMTECLAEELGDRKISVNGLALGSVDTEMFRQAFPDLKASSDASHSAAFIADFVLNGAAYFNGKNLPVARSTP